MSHQDIIRAWKDEEYRNSLSESERAQLPENPAGLIELADSQLEAVAGGNQGRAQTITHTIDVCCSTGGLPCNTGTNPLCCIVQSTATVTCPRPPR
jgi:mersacidin/lichenicidin family type 2 lantibiotic